MEFAVVVDPSPQQRARLAALAEQTGALIEAGNLIAWASSDRGLAEEDGMIICGLADLNGMDDDEVSRPDLHRALAICTQNGAEALPTLDGSFSLVVWERNAEKLTVIRDRFGLQPCYHTSGTAPAFSSDMRLLAHVTGVALEPDLRTVSGFIAGHEDDERQTAFQNIARLPKGHMAHWSSGTGLTDAPYWSLSLPPPIPMKEVESRVRSALQDATGRSLKGKDRVGCMLSGGLDSSSLAVLAAREQDAPLRTLSFVYRDTDSYNERPYIDEINAVIGADPLFLQIDGAPPPDALAELVEEQFDFCPAPGLVKSRQIYAAARENGLTALIDGHGGDEVISHGYARQAELAARGAYWALWRELRGASRVYGMPVLENYLAYLFQYAPLRKRSLIRRAIRWAGRRVARPRPANIDTGALLDPDFRTAQDLDARRAPTPEDAARAEGGPNERLDHLHNVGSLVMARSFDILRRSARAQNVEPIYPFFDRRLVETCLSVPSEAKLQGGWSRYALRVAMEGLLPRSIQWRPDKADFGSEVLSFVLNYLDDPARRADTLDRLAGIIDPQVFESTHRALQAGEGKTGSSATLAIWRCLYAAEWFKRLETWAKLQQEGKLWPVH